MEKQLKVSTVYPTTKLSWNDWCKEFNVSTKYQDKKPQTLGYHFDTTKFAKNTVKKIKEI